MWGGRMTEKDLTAQLNHVWALYSTVLEAMSKLQRENDLLRTKLETIKEVLK